MLASQEVVDGLTREELNDLSVRCVGTVSVQGRMQPIDIYEVFDVDPKELRELKRATLVEFQAGVRYVKEGNYAEALLRFEAVLTKSKDDPVANYYATLIKENPTALHADGGSLLFDKAGMLRQ